MMVAHHDVVADEQRPLVLYVEASQPARAPVRRLLASAGFHVLAVRDTPAALALLHAGALHPDLLLVGFEQSGEMNGADVAEALAAGLAHPPPTVMLTGAAVDVEIPWIHGAPFWLVPRPFEPRVLIAGLRALARFHRDTLATAA
jgi:DNA-binding response OmpR family regulator